MHAPARHLALAVALALACVASPCRAATSDPQAPWTLDGIEFVFPSGVVGDVLRAAGFPASHAEASVALTLRFADGAFALCDTGGSAWLTGTYTQPAPRRVALELDAQGAALLVARHASLTSTWAQEAGLGTSESALEVTRARLRLRLLRRHDDGFPEVRARWRADLRTRGTTLPDGLAQPVDVRSRTRLRAESVEVPEFLLDGTPPPPPPVASFALGASSGEAPLTIGLLSTAQGLVTARRWTFGDGGEAEGTSVQHTFGPGEHLVVHRVEGPGGADETAQFVTVHHAPWPLQTLSLAVHGQDTPDPSDDVPYLAFEPVQGGADTLALGGGDEFVFGCVLPVATNGAPVAEVSLALSTTPIFGVPSLHPLEVALRWVRPDGSSTTLLGPEVSTAAGEAQVVLQAVDAPPLAALPGDRLELVLRDLMPPDPTGSVLALLRLADCRVEVAAPP